MTWQEFWHLFHKRWGSDHESPEYNKAEWNQMQQFLEEVQKPSTPFAQAHGRYEE